MSIQKLRYADGNREEWLAIRKELKGQHRHGGSDTGKIFDANPYESAYAYFQKCVGNIPEQDDSFDTEAMRQGRDAEQYVADRFMELTGKHCHVENCVFVNDDYPAMFATIDRKVDNEDAGLECKNHKDTVMGKYRNLAIPFPTSHFYQVMAYMMVCGFSRYYLAIRIYGTGFKVYFFTRHADDQKPEWAEAMYFISDEDINAVKQRIDDFNAMVASGDWQWGFDGSDATTKAQAERFAGSLVSAVDLEPVVGLMKQIKEAADATKEAEAKEEALKQELREWLGSHHATGGKYVDAVGNSYSVSFKEQTTSRLNADCIRAALGGEIPPEYYKTSTAPVMRVSVRAKK